MQSTRILNRQLRRKTGFVMSDSVVNDAIQSSCCAKKTIRTTKSHMRFFRDNRVPRLVLHSPHSDHAHGPIHREGRYSSVWAILPLRLGRTVACRRYIQASSRLRKLPYLSDGPGVTYAYTGGGWAGEIVYNDSERDESTEEQLQCNEQYKCTPYGTLSPLSPAMACAMAIPEHPNPCKHSASNPCLRLPKHKSCDMHSLIPSPYCGEQHRCLI